MNELCRDYTMLIHDGWGVLSSSFNRNDTEISMPFG
jgi:hypothetical protein